jgi:cytoplasmic iron level regulating protein YaaA (DUF328/UPF0246 family)
LDAEMQIVLSPAKTPDCDTPATIDLHDCPDFVKRSAELLDMLKSLSWRARSLRVMRQ